MFPTGNGELVLAVRNDRQFASLAAVLGMPELADDARFATNSVRVKQRDALRRTLEGQFEARPAAAWAAALTTAGVPAGVVNDVAGGFPLGADLGLAAVVEVLPDDGTTVGHVQPDRLVGDAADLPLRPAPPGRVRPRQPPLVPYRKQVAMTTLAPEASVPTGSTLRFVAAAYERRALAVGSHHPFENWGRFLPEHTTAVSLLERLLHHCHTVITDGESYRMREARSRGRSRPRTT